MRRFGLRDLLPKSCQDPADDELRRQLDAILHHHALAVWVVPSDLLAYEWRSEKIGRQLDALTARRARGASGSALCRAGRTSDRGLRRKLEAPIARCAE